jgi:CheY-like chemotaxis protein
VNQRLISRILEKMGHSVMVANDGAAALVMLATGFQSSSHGYANANHGWG